MVAEKSELIVRRRPILDRAALAGPDVVDLIRRQHEMLREMEWEEGYNASSCIVCHARNVKRRHHKGCELKALLDEVADGLPPE